MKKASKLGRARKVYSIDKKLFKKQLEDLEKEYGIVFKELKEMCDDEHV